MNIYSCLKGENSGSSDNQTVKRICELTIFSRATIYRVIEAGDVVNYCVKRKRVGQKHKKLDNAFKEVIRPIVYEFDHE